MLKYLILFLIASVFSFLLTPLLRSFAIKVGAMDIPGERKIHDQPTPRLGGLTHIYFFQSDSSCRLSNRVLSFPSPFSERDQVCMVICRLGHCSRIGCGG